MIRIPRQQCLIVSFLACASLLPGLAPLVVVHGMDIETESPFASSDTCVKCESDDDCENYATNSLCENGQCTDNNGQFGRGCRCQENEECATGRCGGLFFSRTCRLKLENGSVCNENSACISNICGSMFLCTPPADEPETSLRAEPIVDVTDEPTAAPTLSPTSSPLVVLDNAGGYYGADDDALTIVDGDDMACVECLNDSECGDGFCVDNLCTEPNGVHPPFCVTCVTDDECSQGYYCDGDFLLGKTGKKCRIKKQNWSTCNRHEECRSDHCNILFRCESNLPDHLQPPREPTFIGDGDNNDAKNTKSTSVNNITMWASIAGGLFLVGTCICVLFRRARYYKICLDGKPQKNDDNSSIDDNEAITDKNEK